MRPTIRAVVLFAVAVPLAFLLVIRDAALWPVSLAYPLLALVLIAADALMILPRRSVAVSVAGPRRLPVGDTGEVSVTLGLPARGARTTFTLLLEQAGIADPPQPRRAVRQVRELRTTLPLRAPRRGRVTLQALWLRWRGPLGLIEHRWRNALDIGIDVVPIIRGLRSAALAVTLRAGLDNRHIDWKRSARHGKLLSKSFRTERNHPIILAFDTGHLMLEPISGKTRLDHAIEAGLLLAMVSLRGGDIVGDFAFDAVLRQVHPPLGGMPQLAHLQASLSRLAYATEETNFTLGFAELDARLKRRSLVVLFTEFADAVTAQMLVEGIGRLARRHAVIAVTLQDPAMSRLVATEPSRFEGVASSVIAHDFLRERRVVLERIARLGIHVVDVPAAELSVAIVNKYLSLKQRDQI